MRRAPIRHWLSDARVQMAAVFLVALGIRLVIVAALGDAPPVKDGMEYNIYAINLLKGRGFGGVFSMNLPVHETLRAFRMPLYPLFLAVVYGWFGFSFLAARLAQAVLGAVTCVLVYRIAHRLCGRRTAVVASLVACGWPGLLTYTGLLMTETLFTMLVLLAIDWYLAALERPAGWWCAAAGIAGGLALLTRIQGLGLIAMLVVLAGWQAARARLRWQAAGLVLAACLLTYAPWVVRNWRLFHRVVPLTSQAGAAFGVRNSTEAGGGIAWAGEAVSVRGHESYARLPDELAWSSSLWNRGWAFIRHQPLLFLRYVTERAALFWSISPEWWASPWQGWLRAGFYAFAIFGWIMLLRRRPPAAWLLLALVAGYAVPLWMVGNGSARVRMPIEPLLLIAAAYTVGREQYQALSPDAVTPPRSLSGMAWRPAFAWAWVVALVLVGGPLRAARHPQRIARAFDYAVYVRESASVPSGGASRSPHPPYPVELVDRAWRTSGDPSASSVIGERVRWTGGLYYNLLPASELRGQFTEQAVFLVNMNLAPRTFGDGLIVVAYDGSLPAGLAYEQMLQGSGTVVGTWHQLLVVRADQLARQAS